MSLLTSYPKYPWSLPDDYVLHPMTVMSLANYSTAQADCQLVNFEFF